MNIFLFLFIQLTLFPAFADFSDKMRVKQRYLGLFNLHESEQFKTVQNLDPYRRRTVDLKEIEMEVEVDINPQSRFEIGIAFEHGGTGSSIEFDNFEEFGEFESEVERGGEVEIEEAYYQHRWTSETLTILGKAPLYISLNSGQNSPLDNPATEGSLLESRMIPNQWKEIGFQLHSRWSDFTFRLGVVSGLNSEFFRKYNWIGGGHQKGFEKINADDPAALVSFEYGDAIRGRGVALGWYYGNTTHNRYKKDKFTNDGYVELKSLMASWTFGNFSIFLEGLDGTLENSEGITTANNTLGGLAKPGSFGALGARAKLGVFQGRYEVTPDWIVFGQWEHLNTFADVQGSIYADPRYDVRHEGLGVFHRWSEMVFWRLHSWREFTALDGLPSTDNILFQFGFDTGEF